MKIKIGSGIDRDEEAVYCKLNMTEVANRNSLLVKGGNPQKCRGPLQA
jgi:hypothetical protein